MKLIAKTDGLVSASAPALLIAVAAMGLTAMSASATEMVYVPINPAFGGNPLNASGLLNAAQATNKHKEPVDQSSRQTSLQQFNDMLERSVLSQLSFAATADVVGATGKLKPGTVETGNFRIAIVDLGGGLLQITTTDKITGNSTSFQVGQ